MISCWQLDIVHSWNAYIMETDKSYTSGPIFWGGREEGVAGWMIKLLNIYQHTAVAVQDKNHYS